MGEKLEVVYLSGQPNEKNLKKNLLMGLLIFGIFWASSYGLSIFFFANGTIEERATVTFYKDILSSMSLFLAMFTVIRVLKPNLPIDFILHNPENSIFNRIVGRKWLTTKRLFLISMAFGVMITLMINFTGFTLIASPTGYAIDPIVGKVRSAFLKANPTSPAENVLIFGVIEGLIFLLIHRIIKIPWHIALVMTILIVGIMIFPGYHWAKYGSQNSDLTATAIFGTTNAGISAVTGSLLITEVFHQTSNFFGEMRNAKTWGISVQWGS